VRRALSLGAGSGHGERFLAARFPEIRLDVDRGVPADAVRDLPNVRRFDFDMLASPDEAGYDFVFAVGRLQGAPDPRSAFRNAAAKARPGGWLYVAEPKGAIDARRLEEYYLASRYEILSQTGFADAALIRPLEELRRALDGDATRAELESFVSIFILDLSALPEPSRQWGGLEALGRRRSGRAA
jgi:trans-aconitate methyltransferase